LETESEERVNMARYTPDVAAQIKALEEKIKALKTGNERTNHLDREVWDRLDDVGMTRYEPDFERYVSWVALTVFEEVRYRTGGSGKELVRNKRLHELTDDEYVLYKACEREIAEVVIKYSKEAK
jgi:hypothetical protein